MRRPGTLIILIGNRFSALAIAAVVAVVLWQWWQGRAADLAAILAVFGLLLTINASDQVTAWRHWKREWAALEGRPLGFAMPPHAVRGLRILFGLAVWAAMAYGVLTLKPGAGSDLARICFWGGSALLAANMIYRAVKSRRGATAPQRPPADIPVSIDIRSPGSAPSVGSALAAVPAYCRILR